jgi:Ca2+-binding RTX toxin-like protein
MSFQGPPTANDAESRASADPSDAAAHQSNFEVLKNPRAFLLEEAPLDRVDRVNGSLHLGQTVKLDATPIVVAQIVEDDPRLEMMKPAEVEPPNTQAESPHVAIGIEQLPDTPETRSVGRSFEAPATPPPAQLIVSPPRTPEMPAHHLGGESIDWGDGAVAVAKAGGVLLPLPVLPEEDEPHIHEPIKTAPVITSDGGSDTASVNVAENGTAVTTVTATDPDAGATLTYSIVGGADAAKFTVDANTGALSFVSAPDSDNPTDAGGDNVYDVIVQVSDGTLTDTQVLAVTVGNLNDSAPVITSDGAGASASVAVAENATTVTIVTASDFDAGATLTYSIIGGADAAKFTVDASTGELSFVSAPDYETPTDADGNNIYNVIVQVSDGTLTDTQAISATVTDINDEAPVVTSDGAGATASVTVAENATVVTTVTATDLDAGSTLTYSIVGGADAAKFTVDASTGALSFVPAPDFENPTDAGGNNVYDVTVQVSDGTLTDTQAIAVTVTNLNDNANAPVITSDGAGAGASVSVAENATVVTTVTATDLDAGSTLTYSIVGGADSAKFTVDANTGALSFVAAADYENPTDIGGNNVYDVTVQVSDGALTDTQAIAVTVTNLNDNAPVITSNGAGAVASVNVAENTTAVTTVTATDLDAGATLTYAIVGGADAARFTVDANTGALSFVSAPDAESPTDAGGNNIYDVTVKVSDGTLTDTQAIAVTVTNTNDNAPVITSNGAGASASVNVAENATAVTTVTASDLDAGATLTYSIVGGADAAKFTVDATTGALSFVSAPDYETPTDAGGNNIYDVTVQVSDGTLTDAQAIAVTVTGVNDNAPVITSNGAAATTAVSVTENATAVTTVTATDLDAGATLTYSIVGGADAAKFTVDANTGALSFVSAPDAESPTDAGGNNIYDVTVQVSDGTLTDTQAIAVTVTNLNDNAPVITSNGAGASASVNVAENATAVTTVTATDLDAGATLTYAIVGGADAAKFTVDATTGALSFVSAPDHETPTDAGGNNIYDVTVQVSDGTLTDTQAIAVTVTNVNDNAPVITSNGAGVIASVNVAENATAVTTVTATDLDAGATLTYSIVGGADAAKFTVDANTGALTFVSAPDYETPTDAGGNNIYDVTVQVSDGTLTDTQAIAVTVTNTNDNAPVITSNGAGVIASVNVAENTTAVTTVTATDLDAGATLTYSIVGGADAAKFTVDANTGALSFVFAPDAETPTDAGGNNVYDVTVQVSDGTLTDTQAIAVTVTDVNDNAPVITSDGAGASASVNVAENTTAVTTVTTTDPDAGATLIYAIVGGADSAKFTIDANTGALSFVSAPSYEGPTDTGGDNIYDVTVQVSDGTSTDTQAIAVTATDVAEHIQLADGGVTFIDTAVTEFSVTGGSGNDTIVGTAGDDHLYGGAGNDNLYGQAGNDIIAGGDGNDTLFGEAGDDTVYGDAGNDNIIGGTGADTLDGGTGDDTANYSASSAGVTVNLANAGAQSGGDAAGDILSNFEDIQGSGYDDTLTGDANDNSIYGGTGNDTIAGGAGNDNLFGDAGNDTIFGEAGSDTITGGAGADTIDGGIGTGSDAVSYSTSSAGVTVNLANAGAQSGSDAAGDIISNVENIIGSGYDDTLTGDANTNTVYGEAGNDTISGGAGADTLDGGTGTDTANYSASASAVTVNLTTNVNTGGDAEGDNLIGIENVTGSAHDDVLTGDAGANALSGGAGNDTLAGGAGADTLTGGGGTDTANYSASTSAVTVNLATNVNTGGDAAGDNLAMIENLIGSIYTDVLTGDAGDNTLAGGAGADTIVGGSGTDTADYSASASAVSVDLATNINTGGDAQGDNLTGIENITGSAYNDVLSGDAGVNVISGGAGNDVFAGADGADTIIGGSGTDTAGYTESTSAVTVNLATNVNTGGDAQGDSLTGIESLMGSAYDDVLTGDTGDNTIAGMDGDDTIYGGAGNDFLAGGDGNDILIGGLGNDSLLGGDGIDTADYSGAASAVTVDLSVTTAQNTIGAGIDTLDLIENLTGSAYNDMLTGDAGGNVISGGAGNDTISAGAGNDLIAGGAGADILDGGTGTDDMVTYSASSAGVTVNLTNAGAQSGGDAAGDILSNFNDIIGSAYDDTLTGDANYNYIRGGDGNDTIHGGDGDDTLIGGSGNDTMTGGAGTTHFTGQDGDDIIIGGSGQLVADAGDGNDTVTGGGANDFMQGSGGNDTLSGGAGFDALEGGSGDDILTGGIGGDTLDGGDGSDTFVYNTGDGNDIVAAGAGASWVDTIRLNSGASPLGAYGVDWTVTLTSGSILSTDTTNDVITLSQDAAGHINLVDGGTITFSDIEQIVWAGNDNAPVITSNGAGAGAGVSIAENGTGVTTVTATDLDAGSTLTYAIVGGADAAKFTVDANTGALSFVSAPDYETPTDAGGNNIYDVTVQVSDGTLTDTQAIAVTVTNVSENVYTPVITSNGAGPTAAVNVAENATAVTTVTATDLDAGSTLTYSIVGGADAAKFTIDANTGVLIFASASDFETPTDVNGDSIYDVTVQVSDGSLTDTQAIAVTATDIAENVVLANGGVTFTDLSVTELSVTGGTGNDTITGSAGDDNLYGGAGNDTISGVAGNDVITGGAGSDTLDGGTGTDTASYSASASAVTVNLLTNVNTGGDAAGDSLSGFENITGSAFNDTLTGDAGANVLTGGAGDDTLRGGAGADTLVGGSGIDMASYSTSASGVTINLTTNVNTGGDAQGDALSGIEDITGSAYDDVLTGNGSVNYIYAGAGNDIIAGGASGDIIDGEAGIDTVDYTDSYAAVSVNLATGGGSGGDSGGDELYNIENLIGSVYADTLIGSAAANVITGGSGNDIIVGAGGADTIVGGSGTDTADYSTSASAVTVNLATGVNTGGDAQGDTLTTIENLTGSDYNDTLTGNAGANVLSGGTGNDTLAGGAGADTLTGGSGTDTADYSASASAVSVNLKTNANTGGDAASDSLSGIENVTGSANNDTLTGDSNANVLSGGGGIDAISGGGGNDSILGGSGDDILTGDFGADTLDGGIGTDTANYSTSASAVTVNLATNVNTGGDAQGDSLLNIEEVTGSDYNDALTGDSGVNYIVGGDGNDTLVGGAGADQLRGDYGIDTADYSASTAAVSIDLNSGIGSGGDAEGDQLYNVENLIGSIYADELIGDAGANVLTGGSGNDTLTGGAGADTLAGGSGTDTANYSASASAVTVNLMTNVNTGGDAQGDSLSGIENITGSAYDDTLTGNAGVNVITGGAGDDFVIGGAGADILDGGTGTDDVVDYSASSAGVTVNLTNAGAQSGGDAAGDILSNFDDIIGSAYDDTLTGDANYNYIDGGDGNDTIDGGDGDDTLIGGSGNDTITGGTGDTHVSGNDGDDMIIAGSGQIVADGGDGNDTITGGGSSDFIQGSWGNDTLSGGGSNDYLEGGSEDDILAGGSGADTLDGGSEIDTADYSASASAVTLDLATNVNTGGDAAGDSLSNIENLTGSAYNDTLTGDAGANVLSGGAGNDALSGGGGSDSFIYYVGDGNDTVTGGAAGGWTDTINLNDGSTTALGTYGVDWTLTITSGSVSSTDTGNHVITLSQDAAGHIDLSNGATINFTELERVTW